MATLIDEVSVRLFDDEEVFHDGFYYLCGRLLSKKTVALPSLSSALSSVWGLSERVLVRQEMGDILVFQFKEVEVKNRVLSGGPWFYNNSMLLLADYDGLSALDAAPLHLIDVWVAVKGLPMGLRSLKALTRIGQELGEFGRVDSAAVHRKDEVQRVRVRMDVRRRFWPRRRFEFSTSVAVVVDLYYERCHGLCSVCGLFGHGGGGCDNLVAAALSEAGFSKVVASSVGEEDGLPELVPDSEPDSLRVDGRVIDGNGPNFSAPILNLNLGLTAAGAGLGGPVSGLLEDDGSYEVAVGPRVLGSKQSPFGDLMICEASSSILKLKDVLGDLEEPIITFRKKKKRGRPYGSKNVASSKKKKSGVGYFPVVAAPEFDSPDDKGKRAT